MASERRTDFDPPITLTAQQIATLAQDGRDAIVYSRLITPESVDEALLVSDQDADEGSAAWLEHDGSWYVAE